MKYLLLCISFLSFIELSAQNKTDFYGRWLIFASEDKTYMMTEDNLEERTVLLYFDFRDTAYTAQISREPEKGKWNWNGNGKEISLNNRTFQAKISGNQLEMGLLDSDKKVVMLFKAKKLPENIALVPPFLVENKWKFHDFILSSEAKESIDSTLLKSFDEMKKSGHLQLNKNFSLQFETGKANISGFWWIDKDTFYQHSFNGTLQKAKIFSLTSNEFIYGDENLKTVLKKQ